MMGSDWSHRLLTTRLICALSEGRGPDVAAFPVHWACSAVSRASPAPAEAWGLPSIHSIIM
jgi:hypothetical protein